MTPEFYSFPLLEGIGSTKLYEDWGAPSADSLTPSIIQTWLGIWKTYSQPPLKYLASHLCDAWSVDNLVTVSQGALANQGRHFLKVAKEWLWKNKGHRRTYIFRSFNSPAWCHVVTILRTSVVLDIPFLQHWVKCYILFDDITPNSLIIFSICQVMCKFASMTPSNKLLYYTIIKISGYHKMLWKLFLYQQYFPCCHITTVEKFLNIYNLCHF